MNTGNVYKTLITNMQRSHAENWKTRID